MGYFPQVTEALEATETIKTFGTVVSCVPERMLRLHCLKRLNAHALAARLGETKLGLEQKCLLPASWLL